MKKIYLFVIIVTIATMFAFAAQAPFFGAVAARVTCPHGGWNTMACQTYSFDVPGQSVAFLINPPVVSPNVGWNS
jgi:hypothetical protein